MKLRVDGTFLGSARAWRVGCGVSPQQAFEQRCIKGKVRAGAEVNLK